MPSNLRGPSACPNPKHLFLALATVASLWAAPPRAGAASIVVGTYALFPDRPNQQVPVYVTGGGAIQGLDLNVQIGDGGAAAGSSVPAPKITGVDLTSGTIFASNNTGPQDLGSYPQLALYAITTQTGTVDANGLLATLTIDTTGLAAGGNWTLSLGKTLNGSTDFAGASVPLSITDGHLQASTSFLPGDLNFDGNVDDSDTAAFVLATVDEQAYVDAYVPAAQRATFTDADFLYIADFNYDGNVDDSDTAAFIAATVDGNFPPPPPGAGPSFAASVPEPAFASAILLVPAALRRRCAAR